MTKATRTRIQKAYKEAEELGKLVLVKPRRTRSDGSPLLRHNEVYVTKTGKLYHVGWCRDIALRWELYKGIFVTRAEDVGLRTEHQDCVPMTWSKDTSEAVPGNGKLSTPLLDARHAEKKAREAEARRRVNGG